MAAVGSEAASLVGWLAWDMADHGSARTWYGSAIKAARTAGDPLLGAYQTGSLTQFEVEAGNTAEGLRLIARARRQLGPDLPAIAAAWLASIEAVAHATAGDERATERSLRSCEQHTARVPREDPPPWPWVFSFDDRKVASCHVVCGARLGRPQWGLSSQEIATALSSGHEKQRALLTLDVATGHLSTGRVDSAFALATRAVQDGLRLRSGRIVERAALSAAPMPAPRRPVSCGISTPCCTTPTCKGDAGMRLGITGHRGLSPEVEAQVRDELTELIADYRPEDLVGISCIADGPDTWFAQAVLAHGGRLEVVIPAAEYRESLPDWHHPVYDELTSRAADVHHTGMRESNSQAHQAGSEIVVGLADQMIAVWDGQPARGYGGTADVVAYARRVGVPVRIVWPEGATRD